MNQAEWLACEDPAAMLGAFRNNGPDWANLPPVSARKLRLFACACCRQVWHLLTDDAPCVRCEKKGELPGKDTAIAFACPRECPDCHGTGRVNRSRRAVEMAERFADSEATADQLEAARRSALAVPYDGRPYEEQVPVLLSAWACDLGVADAADGIVRDDRWQSAYLRKLPLAALLREVVGDPFAKIKGYQWQGDLATPWLQWVINADEMRVWNMASRIYERRDWVALPVLADAVLDVTGEEDEVTAHFRSAGPHALGCWALDLVLGLA